MFDTLIVQPIFNLLVFIYALLPGHDFGVAIIIFTIIVRLLMWPLLKRQLRHQKAMRELQPEIKKIRAKTKGDKQREAQLVMELYKEREINPFSSLGILIIQIPILIGLFAGLRRLTNDPQQIIDFSYGFVQNLSFIQEIATDLTLFDKSFFGIDLSRSAFGEGGVYIPLLILAILAGIVQYYQSKQLLPEQKDSKSLRQILRDGAEGKEADQSEVQAAMGRNMRFLFPALTFIFAATFPGSLALYWATGSFIGLIQQTFVLRQDVEELKETADKVEAKESKSNKKKKTNKGGKKKGKRKRR